MVVAPGQVLAGKYRVDRILGQGGMGMVVAATHTALRQRVAMKFMLPEAAANQAFVARFLREAQASVRLRNEHVGRVLDVGTLEDGAPYIVMEYLEGTDLSNVLRGNGPLPISVATDYVLHACMALAEAHALGIVHRDLKPGNLFLTNSSDGQPLVKVIDFGISKVAANDTDGSMTQTGMQMGSPAYMSPEQLRSSRSVDARSDIWAMGIVLYELVTGRVPFFGVTFSEICLKVGMDPAPRLEMIGRGIPPAFAAVVHRCLEKDPDARFADVTALAAALAPFASEEGRPLAARISRVHEVSGGGRPGRASVPPGVVRATPLALGAMGPGPGGTITSAMGEVGGGALPRRPFPLVRVLGGVAGVAALVVGLVALTQGGGETVASPTTPTVAVTTPNIAPSSVPPPTVVLAPASPSPSTTGSAESAGTVTPPAAAPAPPLPPLVEKTPATDPAALLAQAKIAARENKWDEALRASERVLEMSPDSLEARKLATMAACERLDLAAALRHSRQLPAPDAAILDKFCISRGVTLREGDAKEAPAARSGAVAAKPVPAKVPPRVNTTRPKPAGDQNAAPMQASDPFERPPPKSDPFER